MKTTLYRTNFDTRRSQSGINMVDLMMWLVIAALLLAAAIQGMSYYQKAAYLYHMKSDLYGAGEVTMAKVADNEGNLSKSVVDMGVSEAKWSKDVAHEVRAVTTGNTKPYILATHPGVTDLDAIYIFENCGDKYKIGVNVIPKGGDVTLTACGIDASPLPDSGDGSEGTDGGTGGDTTPTTETGMLVGWGDGDNLQLGTGPIQQETLHNELFGKTITLLDDGSQSACALADGELYCWSNYQSYTDHGAAFTLVPMQKTGLLVGKTVTDISVGLNTTCVVADARAYCFGQGDDGQLGDGNFEWSQPNPVLAGATGVMAGKDIKDVEAMYRHSCALDTANIMYCWGWDIEGGLGNDTALSGRKSVPVAVKMDGALAGSTIAQMSIGMDGTCVLNTLGKAFCWGNSGFIGTTGEGSPAYYRAVPTSAGNRGVLLGKSFTDIDASTDNTCVLSSGQRYCWGHFTDGTPDTNNPILRMAGIPAGTVLVSMDSTGCVFTSNNEQYCGNDQLYGTIPGNGFDKPISEAAYSCVISDGSAYCQDNGVMRPVAREWMVDKTKDLAAPFQLTNLGAMAGNKVSSIDSNSSHSCAVEDGGVYCWGQNNYGQLGDGTTTTQDSPVKTLTGAIGTSKVTSVATGFYNSCAIADGKAYCWGDNGYGQLGDGTTTDSLVPVAVKMDGALGGKPITHIALGDSFACALADSKVYCWGYGDDGELGNGAFENSSVPVAVDVSGVLSGQSLKYLDVNEVNACVGSDSNVYCWGANWYGQLGDSWDDSSIPLAVDTNGVFAGKVISGVSVSEGSMCAVASGAVYCWGSAYSGELGNGTNDDTYAPSTPVSLSGNITSLTAGSYHSCVLADGKPYCWGENYDGELGNGTQENSNVPVLVTSDLLTGKEVTGVFAGGYTTFLLFK
jgi:alpha-tubulin suppressor-like RCC1 family protein